MYNIKKTISILKNGLNDGSRRFLLKYNEEYVGVLRVRTTKYDKYYNCGELGALYLLDSVKKKGYGKILFKKAISELKDMGYSNMILGCLQDNPSNDFYKHMGGVLVDSKLRKIGDKEYMENIYFYNSL